MSVSYGQCHIVHTFDSESFNEEFEAFKRSVSQEEIWVSVTNSWSWWLAELRPCRLGPRSILYEHYSSKVGPRILNIIL